MLAGGRGRRLLPVGRGRRGPPQPVGEGGGVGGGGLTPPPNPAGSRVGCEEGAGRCHALQDTGAGGGGDRDTHTPKQPPPRRPGACGTGTPPRTAHPGKGRGSLSQHWGGCRSSRVCPPPEEGGPPRPSPPQLPVPAGGSVLPGPRSVLGGEGGAGGGGGAGQLRPAAPPIGRTHRPAGSDWPPAAPRPPPVGHRPAAPHWPPTQHRPPPVRHRPAASHWRVGGAGV